MDFPPPPALLAARDLRAPDLENSPAEALLRIYAWMHLARVTDNRILDLFRHGLIRGTVAGGQGNEALIVPLALLADKAIDVVSFSHRDLGGHSFHFDCGTFRVIRVIQVRKQRKVNQSQPPIDDEVRIRVIVRLTVYRGCHHTAGANPHIDRLAQLR